MDLLIIAVLAGPGTAGALMLLRAAGQERRFLLEPGRRLARAGGLWMMWGAAPLLLLLSRPLGIGRPATGGTVVLMLAAGIGLLSGLSRKPRPGGYVAAGLQALGLALLLLGGLNPG